MIVSPRTLQIVIGGGMAIGWLALLIGGFLLLLSFMGVNDWARETIGRGQGQEELLFGGCIGVVMGGLGMRIGLSFARGTEPPATGIAFVSVVPALWLVVALLLVVPPVAISLSQTLSASNMGAVPATLRVFGPLLGVVIAWFMCHAVALAMTIRNRRGRKREKK